MQEVYNDFEENNLKIIGDNLRFYRMQKKYSQEILAEKADCSREYVNKIENRKGDLSLKMLLKMAYALEIAPQELFIKD